MHISFAVLSVRIKTAVFVEMRDVKDIIRTLQQDIEGRNVLPAIVPLRELLKVAVDEIKRDLWELVKKGEVKMHQTLNGHSFSVPEGDNNNTDDEQRTG